MNKNRLEALSDGVFAIVITLLVLEIKVPHVSTDELGPALYALLPKFLSFGLSFIIIAVYWISHHSMMHFITKTDRNALWLNILLLLTICIIPFPTALIGDYPDVVISIIFYGLTLSAVNLSGTLFWIYCTKNNRLTGPNLRPEFARRVALLHLSPVILYLIAIGCAFISVKISFAIILGVPLFFIVPNRWMNRLFSNPYIQ
jgi:uncharacterized membrane protein